MQSSSSFDADLNPNSDLPRLERRDTCPSPSQAPLAAGGTATAVPAWTVDPFAPSAPTSRANDSASRDPASPAPPRARPQARCTRRASTSAAHATRSKTQDELLGACYARPLGDGCGCCCVAGRRGAPRQCVSCCNSCSRERGQPSEEACCAARALNVEELCAAVPCRRREPPTRNDDGAASPARFYQEGGKSQLVPNA